MKLATFLRTVLKLDAASCLAMAAIVIPLSGMLSQPLGIEAAALGGAARLVAPGGLRYEVAPVGPGRLSMAKPKQNRLRARLPRHSEAKAGHKVFAR